MVFKKWKVNRTVLLSIKSQRILLQSKNAKIKPMFDGHYKEIFGVGGGVEMMF